MKLKKIMAGLLGAAMLLGTLGTALTASAADSSTIDTARTGSLTIEKYEGEDTSKPLEGVTFAIYQIASIEQKTTAGSTSVELKSTVQGLRDDQITWGTTYDDIKDTVSPLIANQTLKAKEEKTTAKEAGSGAAKVTFSELPLGVYLVVEKDAPSQVVEKTANFLVSIPMTNEDGTAWVYDVTAKPKNQTVYGGIVLHKKGETLDAATGNPSESNLAGIQFRLERKKEPDTWETVKNGENDVWTTNSAGTINVTDLVPGTYRFTEAGRAPEADGGFILDRSKSYEFTVDSTGKATGNGFVISDSGSGTYTFEVKNEKPQVDKVIQGGKKTDTAQVGDTVTWEISASIPSTIKELKTFQLKDQLSKGLTVKPQAEFEATVTADGTSLTKDTDYTVTVGEPDASGTLITITFTEDGKEKMEGKKVVKVVFESTLNNKAVVGKDGNPNAVTLEYSNEVRPGSEPGEPDTHEEKPDEDPVVFTFALDIYKFYQQGGQQSLQGAKFAVYTSEDAAKEGRDAIATGTSGADGTVTFTSQTFLFENNEDLSVKEGEYWIVETDAPDGYNLLKEPIKVKFTVTYAGKGEGRHQTVSNVTFEGGTATYDGATGHIKCEIENKKGFTLPETGGMGTMIFTVGGIALVAAGILLILATRRKKTAR